MDRRKAKTRQAIFSAFEHLLAQKHYAKITIEEIINAANVGRSTFYAHFETKDELLHEVCKELFSHVFSTELPIEMTHDFSLQYANLQNRTIHVLYHLRDNRKSIETILSSESSTVFFSYFKPYLIDLMMRCDPPIYAPQCDVPIEFLNNHIAASFFEMIRWWFKNGLQQTPEEMAGYYIAVMQPAAQSVQSCKV